MDVMLREMTAVQLREWMVFYELEPFGDDREDARIGMLVQLLANVYRDPKLHPGKFKLVECVPVPTGDAFTAAVRGKKTWQELKMSAMIIASAVGKG